MQSQDHKPVRIKAANGRARRSKESDPQQPAVPKLTDTESGFNKQNPADADSEKKDSKAGKEVRSAIHGFQGGPRRTIRSRHRTRARREGDEASSEQTDLLANSRRSVKISENHGRSENSTFVNKAQSGISRTTGSGNRIKPAPCLMVSDQRSDAGEKQKVQADRIAPVSRLKARRWERSRMIWKPIMTGRKEEKFLRILQEMEEYKSYETELTSANESEASQRRIDRKG